MLLSDKQWEYMANATHRWNIKCGAVRSGKTYCDYFLIPRRIAKTDGGLILIIGNTRQSAERNIIEPMRNIWGGGLVGRMNADGYLRMFGKEVFVLGAMTENAAEKLQGCSVGYCYGDEVTTWKESVFRMLQSRLDRPESCFDGTCNPDAPSHWFRKFLASDGDIYLQSYTITDNPALSAEFIEELKAEYRGTVFYDRYILGKWCVAQGLIYPSFARSPESFLATAEEISKTDTAVCGLDFGGTKSKTAFCCLGVSYRESTDIIALHSCAENIYTPEQLSLWVCERLEFVAEKYGVIPSDVYCDNAEPVLIRGLEADLERRFGEGYPVRIRKAEKSPVMKRISKTIALLAKRRLLLTSSAAPLSDALASARWGENGERLDNFTSDIDSLDAFEYALERIKC